MAQTSMEASLQDQVDPPLFSFCVTCMNRIDHLRQTLPRNLDVIAPSTDIEIVILDYNSSDSLESWLLTLMADAARCRRVSAYRTEEPRFYSPSHAKNVAHRLARGKVLLNLDADQFLTVDYLAFLRNGFAEERSCVLHGKANSTSGRVALRREHFFGVRGYDEDLEGWGADDTDLILRASKRYGLTIGVAPPPLTPYIAHGDDLRGRCMEQKDVRRSDAANLKRSRSNIAAGKLVANTGRNWGQAKVRGIALTTERSAAKISFERLYAKSAEKGRLGGSGDSPEQTAALVEHLPSVLKELDIRSVVDISCQGVEWLRRTNLSIDRYIGVEFVESAVETARARFADAAWSFRTLDYITETLPQADAVLCRNVLPHLRFADALRTLANIRRSGARFLLATTFVDRSENRDSSSGGWRPLNLQAKPFAFPAPLRSIDERCTEGRGSYRDKHLGIWRVGDLPAFDEAAVPPAAILMPKVFHQIWLGGPLPTEFREYGRTWDRLHPDWERRMWTEADLERLPAFRNRQAFQKAQAYDGKADILRYEILYEYGGVYVDTDFECLRNCEELFVGTEAFVAENALAQPDYACNGFMGAVPRHVFLNDLIESIRKKFDPAQSPQASTGPRLISRVLKRHADVRVVPKEHLYRTDWRGNPVGSAAGRLYADHHWKSLRSSNACVSE